ncbi:Rha family transcriptional regulator, partial [Ornithobacterium rhinotracheale]|uniref:Rha family transcriptional regulator n=3 Tax=Ornithobacterium rhinotracheale TaxID=28251 RepID=UPI0039FC9255
MNNLSIKDTMSSREIAQIAGRPHNDVLKSIRKMERSWRNVTGGNFSLSEYTDSTGRKLPEYQLTKTECLYIATKFNDEARARLVLRWEALENERLKNYIQIPKSISVFGMEALPYDWWLLQNGYSVSSGQRSRRIKKHPEHFYKGTKGWYINKLYAEALLNIKLGKERLQQVQALPQLNQLEMF